jgi:hypothetical protein
VRGPAVDVIEFWKLMDGEIEQLVAFRDKITPTAAGQNCYKGAKR